MALWRAFFNRPARLETPVRPSLTLFFWLAGAFILTLLPHVEQLPAWVTSVVLLAMVTRCLLEWYRVPLPSTTTTAIVAICLLVGIYRQYETILGRDAGTAFMAGLLAIKFYELRGPRDAAMIIFSSSFVVMSALLYSQALELFIYCLIMMWLLTAALLRTSMGDHADQQLLRMLRMSGIIFVQALPLAVFFFFFLPRYTGKFQMVLNDSPIGLTDKLEPGSISRLSENDDLAMYVKFTGTADLPTAETMYWRALVLWQYRRGAWTEGPLAQAEKPLPLPARDSKPLDQEITIWPHNQRWLFALDYPVSKAVNDSEPGSWSSTLYGGIIQLRFWGAKLDHRERYRVTSSTELADEVLDPKSTEYADGIQLPKDDDKDAIDHRVRALADQLHQQNPDTQAYIGAVLHYFRHEHFIYSASPGATPGDWLPTFLFETKRGFCEHYASAFAVLMRLEKIPARVVVGYQGAEFNPYDSQYIVRQSNAHSWDEVWIEAKKHWVRIDPTAILLIGTDSPSPSSSSQSDDSVSIQVAQHRVTFSDSYLPEWVRHTMNDLQLRRQQMEANWDDWVFSYDPETQLRVAGSLGLQTWSLILFCIGATGICYFILQKWMRPRVATSPIEDVYAKFCRNMAQRGIPRAKWEGPLAYTDRVAETFPDKKEAIHDFGTIIARSRYGATPPDPSTPKELQALLNRITAAQAATTPNEEP